MTSDNIRWNNENGYRLVCASSCTTVKYLLLFVFPDNVLQFGTCIIWEANCEIKDVKCSNPGSNFIFLCNFKPDLLGLYEIFLLKSFLYITDN